MWIRSQNLLLCHACSAPAFRCKPVAEILKVLQELFNPTEAVLDHPEVVISLFTIRICGLQEVGSHADDAKRVVDFMCDFANAGSKILKLD